MDKAIRIGSARARRTERQGAGALNARAGQVPLDVIARRFHGRLLPLGVNELSVLDFEVQLRDFADAKFSQALLRRFVPGYFARADQIDYSSVSARLCHFPMRWTYRGFIRGRA